MNNHIPRVIIEYTSLYGRISYFEFKYYGLNLLAFGFMPLFLLTIIVSSFEKEIVIDSSHPYNFLINVPSGILFYCFFSILTRRCHDRNIYGWPLWLFVLFIFSKKIIDEKLFHINSSPISFVISCVGLLYMAYMYIEAFNKKSDPRAIRFGRAPHCNPPQ